MSVLAFDLGAGSGRALLGEIESGNIRVTEVHRFANEPVRVGGRLHWDVLRLFHEIKQGILKAKHAGHRPQSIGIDSWAVDFGLLDRNGELLGNPYHYRDPHTDHVMEEAYRIMPAGEIFARTGIQLMQFNTLFQLYAMKRADSVALEHAAALLMIPDLLRYFLTGEKVSEFTNASTTQMLDPGAKSWDKDMMGRFGIPAGLFVPIVEPGTKVGRLTAAVSEELGVGRIPVIAVAEHDTASAVAGVPADRQDFAYLICGTWSLLGTELEAPVVHEQAYAWNFTNEGGVGGTFRLLKNMAGTWLIQECRRIWAVEGKHYEHGELVRLAEEAPPFQAWIDPDDAMFLSPRHMPAQIQHYCRSTGQAVPQTAGEMMRTVLESLAFQCRFVLERTQRLSGREFPGLHMVGGGIRNELLAQLTANAIGKPVWAGPAEASALGNMAVQWIALGEIGTLEEARAMIRASFPPVAYEPERNDDWERAYRKFLQVAEAGRQAN
ncbi:rhamnulokinase family protein [Paenibacillus sp. MSJ-34]|uniref:rhamnulokinase n=1 Tax=Paenibacillus sp. MSJ-34 TaxID=2841529 RepID=UPI001C114F71|nr:rhamnulokinase [Paenibacillus sp. MSJ-34]